MRLSGASLFLLALAGCATTSTADLRKLPVTETFQTRRAAPIVAQCLAESLNNLGDPSIYATAMGTAVAFTGAGNTLALFEINGSGLLEVRAPMFIQRYREKTEACL
ncbi:hypothetical protein [Rhizorhabdus sp.]|uniref:hypothetical protein n=1 Tax=Rhizorhabdus sp. TaxID=1968843 RepID=UPI0035B1A3BC